MSDRYAAYPSRYGLTAASGASSSSTTSAAARMREREREFERTQAARRRERDRVGEREKEQRRQRQWDREAEKARRAAGFGNGRFSSSATSATAATSASSSSSSLSSAYDASSRLGSRGGSGRSLESAISSNIGDLRGQGEHRDRGRLGGYPPSSSSSITGLHSSPITDTRSNYSASAIGSTATASGFGAGGAGGGGVSGMNERNHLGTGVGLGRGYGVATHSSSVPSTSSAASRVARSQATTTNPIWRTPEGAGSRISELNGPSSSSLSRIGPGYNSLLYPDSSSPSPSSSTLLGSDVTAAGTRYRSRLPPLLSDFSWLDHDSSLFGPDVVPPNIGKKVSLRRLFKTFDPSHGKPTRRKVAQLANPETYGYRWWRPVRGDGNCYYRAVIFQVVEALLRSDDEAVRLVQIHELINLFKESSYRTRSPLDLRHLSDELDDLCTRRVAEVDPAEEEERLTAAAVRKRERKIKKSRKKAADGHTGEIDATSAKDVGGGGDDCEEDDNRDDDDDEDDSDDDDYDADPPRVRLLRQLVLEDSRFDKAIVLATRCVVADFLRANGDRPLKADLLSIKDAVMAIEDMTLEEFCNRVVLKMGEEARDVVVMVLPRLLGITVRTVIVDNSDTPVRVHSEPYDDTMPSAPLPPLPPLPPSSPSDEEEADGSIAGETASVPTLEEKEEAEGADTEADADETAGEDQFVGALQSCSEPIVVSVLLRPGHYDCLYVDREGGRAENLGELLAEAEDAPDPQPPSPTATDKIEPGHHHGSTDAGSIDGDGNGDSSRNANNKNNSNGREPVATEVERPRDRPDEASADAEKETSAAPPPVAADAEAEDPEQALEGAGEYKSSEAPQADGENGQDGGEEDEEEEAPGTPNARRDARKLCESLQFLTEAQAGALLKALRLFLRDLQQEGSFVQRLPRLPRVQRYISYFLMNVKQYSGSLSLSLRDYDEPVLTEEFPIVQEIVARTRQINPTDTFDSPLYGDEMSEALAQQVEALMQLMDFVEACAECTREYCDKADGVLADVT